MRFSFQCKDTYKAVHLFNKTAQEFSESRVMEQMTDYRNIVNMIRKLFLFLFSFFA